MKHETFCLKNVWIPNRYSATHKEKVLHDTLLRKYIKDVSVIHLHDAIAPMNLNKFELGDLERGKKICRKDNYSPRKYIYVKRSKQS